VVLVALLMVSRIPTFSGKHMGSSIPRDIVLPVLGLGSFAAIMLIAYPWEFLTVISVAYLALIPVSMRSYRRHKAPQDQLKVSTRARSAMRSSGLSIPTDRRNTPSPA